jgi:hypothetical protein
VDEIVLLVEGQMKVGNYSVSFRDIDIPVQRFPLTVLRNYDSRYKNKSGDFGYGWNLSMAGATCLRVVFLESTGSRNKGPVP